MTLCNKGHELTSYPSGRKRCLVCARERSRLHRERAVGMSPATDWRADDLDVVAVDRAVKGEPVGRPLHPCEWVEVARRLVRDGGGSNDLIRLLRCSGARARQLLREVQS